LFKGARHFSVIPGDWKSCRFALTVVLPPSQGPASCLTRSGFEVRLLHSQVSCILLESNLCFQKWQCVTEPTSWGRGVKLKENLHISLWQNCKSSQGSSTSPRQHIACGFNPILNLPSPSVQIQMQVQRG
jgi:hypothetical protein